MAETMEKRYRLSLSWEHDKEENYLNRLSAEGLHFEKISGFVRYTLKRDPSVRYTYRLDYQGGFNKKTNNKQEYIGLFEDAGWEYVSSYGNMWHYFRREWREGEEPQLYTDRESMVGFYKRIQSVILILFLSNLIIMSVNILRPGPIRIVLLFLYAFLFAVLGVGYAKLNKKIKQAEG
ncbi:DUF2812 domain-containing protein [Cohnella sp. AR92]|uniref:DUF2812 domain-containing protein n=1 Tax=Cohnella sp. AR92 TaxID=648716 RepID=UPI000F8CDC83|nr:DUF2812 domain-containing protein [Cohnella sp. AR92]RUS43535.1 DUF2812 domain-containing protein [Cohnella sp. AR92]